MSKPRNDAGLVCPKCGTCEWEMEADTKESVTYQVDFERHVFAETNRETQEVVPTDWYCLSCGEPVEDQDLAEALSAEFIDEKSGIEWELIEVDEWSTKEGKYGGKTYDGVHEGCGVNLPHEHT